MKEKKKRRIWRSIGSLVFTAIGFVVIPALIDKCSNMLYKSSLKKELIDFDNLGSKIVKNESQED